MLSWLLLSLWEIGSPFLESEESLNVLSGFILASSVDEPNALISPLFQGQFLLSYLPSALGAHLLPVNDFTLRLPYALIGAAQMPLLLGLVNRSFGKQAALFAGLLLLGTGFFAVNRMASGPAVFVTIELSGALLLLRYIESRERRWLIFSTVVFTFGTLVSITGLFVLLFALGSACFVTSDRKGIGIAASVGAGLLAGVLGVALISEQLFAEWSGFAADESSPSFARALFSDFGTSGLHFGTIFGSWMAYAGFPAAVLVTVGVTEAFLRNRSYRPEIVVLLSLAAAGLLGGLLIGQAEQIALSVVLLLAIASSGWRQLIRQIDSTTAQSMILLTVVAIALAGVVWNQAVFSPETEFTASFSPVRKYVESLDPTIAKDENEALGLKAVSQVLREETGVDDTIFVREDIFATSIKLYATRETSPLMLETFGEDASVLDGAYLVVKGEDETFNAGLSGTINVVENHRVFADGEVFYQLLKFSSNEESFKAPVWWRANVMAAKFESENNHYTDFLVKDH